MRSLALGSASLPISGHNAGDLWRKFTNTGHANIFLRSATGRWEEKDIINIQITIIKFIML
jgi:hypothetical protein